MQASATPTTPQSSKPEGQSLSSHFFDIRNSPLLALVLPGLVEPCRADGTLDLELLNKKINKSLQSQIGRHTTVSDIRKEAYSHEVVASPDVVISIAEPVLRLKTAMLYSIVSSSVPIDGSTTTDSGNRYDDCTVSGLNLKVSLGESRLSIHLGELDDSWWGRNQYSELNRLFDGALSSRNLRGSFCDRYLENNPEKIALFSAMVTDLIADFQERRSGIFSQSRLFPQSSTHFSIESVDKDTFRSLFIPSRDVGTAGSPRIRATLELVERIVTGAEREGLADCNVYRESFEQLKKHIGDLYDCVNYNHMDYFIGVSPNFNAVAAQLQNSLAKVFAELKAIGKATQSFLLFEQTHQAISNFVQACPSCSGT